MAKGRDAADEIAPQLHTRPAIIIERIVKTGRRDPLKQLGPGFLGTDERDVGRGIVSPFETDHAAIANLENMGGLADLEPDRAAEEAEGIARDLIVRLGG
jgi:hypothetical protein